MRGGPRPRQPDQLCDFRGRQVVLAQRHPGIGALDKFWAVAIGCGAGRAAGASSPASVVDAGEVSDRPQRAIAPMEPGLLPTMFAVSAFVAAR